MNKVFLGKYVNTHGIKGEIRIKSHFKYKEKVFKVGNEIIIDKPYSINSYRVHKGYDMVTLKGINSINDIIHLKNSNVYINRDKYLDFNEYLDEDLINFSLLANDLEIGLVNDIRYLNNDKKLFVVNGKLIPFELIEKIDLINKKIYINYVEGLL